MNEMLYEIINEWNPMEIYPLLQNEYQYEINRIQEETDNDQSLQFLTSLVYEVFKDSFGDQFQKTIAECEKIAYKIYLQSTAE